ncbi:MAG: chitobiase/beta-hexosaminidase C-terminal domain-containing protein, partial [Ruminiclostridium sp.]|nr:chitobiase/beta-hexosaminidase C-terminal domain-containing protein [Ruminiclostridium sp.]
MSRTSRALISLFIVLAAVIASFSLIFPINVAALSTVKHSLNYTGKYVMVTLNTRSSGNKIYYTINGSEPSKKSALYKNTLAIEQKLTFRAVEYNKSGKKVATLKITVQPRVQLPEFELVDKSGKTYLKIKCGTSGAKIYYTTDGSTPTTKSERYTGMILCTKVMTVKACAVRSGMKTSVTSVYEYRPGVMIEKEESAERPADVQTVFELMNKERKNSGIAALKLDDDLCKIARTRAKEISEVFSHNRPDGSSCFTALDESGFLYFAAGENIAVGQTSAADVMDNWMNSSGHKANILAS